MGVWDTQELVLHADRDCDALDGAPAEEFVDAEVWDALELQTPDFLRVGVEWCRTCGERRSEWQRAVHAVPWRRRRLLVRGARPAGRRSA